MEKREIYRHIIITNSQKPNRLVQAKCHNYLSKTTKNISCNDRYQIFLKLDNQIITDLRFQGYGCAISKSALNLLANYLTNKSIKESLFLIANYRKMIEGKEFCPKLVKDLIALSGVSKYLNRIPCALIGANTIWEMLVEYGTN